MYRYKIGYSSCEECSYVELGHKKKFSKSDITEMICEAILNLYNKKMDKKKSFFKTKYDDLSFQDLWTEYDGGGIVSWLIEHKGFKKIDYEVVWDVFGWASVLDKDDWKNFRYDDDELSTITDYLHKNGVGDRK